MTSRCGVSSSRVSLSRWALRSSVRALWFVAVPALLAALVLRFLVPDPARGSEGALGLVARLGRTYPVPLGVGLFLLFGALVRYWRFHLPGAGHLSAPPARPNEARAPVGAAKFRDAIGFAVTLFAAAGLALLLRARVVGSYSVLSGSMLPTFHPGDRIGGSKLAYGWRGAKAASPTRLPSRGDVIVFRSEAVSIGHLPGTPEVLVKRVIGLPGDRVGMRGGSPVVNGWLVPSCDAGEYFSLLPGGQGSFHGRLRVEFLEGKAYLTVRKPEEQSFDPYEVEPGEVFVLGDNRDNSLDSRAYNGGLGGGVPLGAIEARVQWFMLGTHRNGGADFGRLFTPIDDARVHLEGMDTRALDEGVARCMRERPKDASASSASY